MNPKTTIRHSIRQALVALLSIGLALGPLADAARAQTPLADIPIASKVTAKPNIVYTLDERATDGFYFARTAEVFRRLVSDPRLLDRIELTVDDLLGAWPRGA